MKHDLKKMKHNLRCIHFTLTNSANRASGVIIMNKLESTQPNNEYQTDKFSCIWIIRKEFLKNYTSVTPYIKFRYMN